MGQLYQLYIIVDYFIRLNMPKGNNFNYYHYKVVDTNKKVYHFRTYKELNVVFPVGRSTLYNLCRKDKAYMKKKFKDIEFERIWTPITKPTPIILDWD